MDSNPTICEEKLTSNPNNITNKTPHSPDDGSAEPKRYSVDWLFFSINPYFLFGLLVVNIYIYIYIVANCCVWGG